MKRLIAFSLIGLLYGGCALVPTDFMPKLTWYWSAEAKQYRAQKKAERERNLEYQRTNSVPTIK